MTSRQSRIARLFLSAAFAALGIWGLADASYVTGAFWLVISAGWLLLAFFNDRIAGRLGRRDSQRP